MPAVILKMLVASEPGRIELLPALPAAWPRGTIEGVLCRGQIEIERLQWDEGRIEVRLLSGKEQSILLEAPGEIGELSVKEGRAVIQETDRANGRRLSLPARQEVMVELKTR
jgi:hypothetical protein